MKLNGVLVRFGCFVMMFCRFVVSVLVMLCSFIDRLFIIDNCFVSVVCCVFGLIVWMLIGVFCGVLDVVVFVV